MENIIYRHIKIAGIDYLVMRSDRGYCYIGNDDDLTTDTYFDRFKNVTFVASNTDEEFQEFIQTFTDYHNGLNPEFDFPMDFIGTPFQVRVWKHLMTIPYGKTESYQEVAEGIGQPTATRACAHAISQNPLMIVAPCHRVLGKDRKLRGFRGGLGMKEKLLIHEGITDFKY
ncbi:MAG: methylated-DNA--[protein]-cysteine S-methyltransferase [Erysipelothrix sp.]